MWYITLYHRCMQLSTSHLYPWLQCYVDIMCAPPAIHFFKQQVIIIIIIISVGKFCCSSPLLSFCLHFLSSFTPTLTFPHLHLHFFFIFLLFFLVRCRIHIWAIYACAVEVRFPLSSVPSTAHAFVLQASPSGPITWHTRLFRCALEIAPICPQLNAIMLPPITGGS